MRVIVAQGTLMRSDLHDEEPYTVVGEYETVVRFLLDRDDVLGILVLDHGYCFAGLNSTTTRRMSWSAVLVNPLSGWLP